MSATMVDPLHSIPLTVCAADLGGRLQWSSRLCYILSTWVAAAVSVNR